MTKEKKVLELDKMKHLFKIEDIYKIIVEAEEIESITFYWDKLDRETGKRHSEIYDSVELCEEVKTK